MKILDIPQSGHLGTFISFKNQHGQCRRPYVIPVNPSTPAQIRDRALIREIAGHWRQLTEAQRFAWNLGGPEVKSQGRLGKSGTLSGFQWHMKINKNLAHVGEPRMQVPPGYPHFVDNRLGELCITNANGVIVLRLPVPFAPMRLTLVWATAPASIGRSFPKRFAYLGLLPPAEAGFSDITQSYVNKFGPPPPYTRLFIRTTQMDQGWQDRPKQTTAIVPPPASP
jgi:hypothetical protein